MFEVTIQTSGLITMSGGQFSNLLQGNTTLAINSTLEEGYRIAREPIPAGPSGIKASINFEPARISTGAATIETQHPKFHLVEEPTKPHDISPRNKKALRFKVGRKIVFTKKTIRHPGTKGKRSFAKADAYVDRALGPAIDQAIEATIQGRRLSKVSAAVLNALISSAA